jgi:hypothetical protein
MVVLVLAGMAAAGCSTHPAGDVLDFFKPGRIYTDGKTTPYGGVCQPQGPLVGPGAGGPPQINVGPPTPLVPEAVAPVIPPPVPITATPLGPGGPAVPPPPPPPVP